MTRVAPVVTPAGALPGPRPFAPLGEAPPRAACLALHTRHSRDRSVPLLRGRARLRWPFAHRPHSVHLDPRSERLRLNTRDGEFQITFTDTLRRDAGTLREALDQLSLDGARPRAWVTPYGLRAIALTTMTGRVVYRPRTIYRAWVTLPDDFVVSVEMEVYSRDAPYAGDCAWIAQALIDAIEPGKVPVNESARRVAMEGANSVDLPAGWALTVNYDCVSARYLLQRVTPFLGAAARVTVLVSSVPIHDRPSEPWIRLDEANDRVEVGLPTRTWNEVMFGRRVTWHEESVDNATRRRASITPAVGIWYEADDREGLDAAEAVVRTLRLAAEPSGQEGPIGLVPRVAVGLSLAATRGITGSP